jgi:HEAT repeat protein
MNPYNAATSAELLQQLDSKDAAAIAGAVRELAARHETSATPRLLHILRTTDNAIVRNAAALALSDLQELEAFKVLVDLLRDDRTSQSRGTLLYALGAYDCSPILPLLVDLVIGGNFEVSQQAFSLIRGIEKEIEEGVWSACTTRLQTALASAATERRPLLAELLSLFTDQA